MTGAGWNGRQARFSVAQLRFFARDAGCFFGDGRCSAGELRYSLKEARYFPRDGRLFPGDCRYSLKELRFFFKKNLTGTEKNLSRIVQNLPSTLMEAVFTPIFRVIP
jgi:hypothetical protein